MQRTGIVVVVHGDIVAIATDDGWTIIETSGWSIDLGDEVSWKSGYGLGAQVYENRTQNSHAEVFVQDHSVNRETFVNTYCK